MQSNLRAIAICSIAAWGFSCSSDNIDPPPPPPQVVLSSIAVTPMTAMIQKDAETGFTAQGTYSDGTTKDLTAEVSWTSEDLEVAVVDGSGLATALKIGTTEIRATLGTIVGRATLTVLPSPLMSLAVAPREATIAPGEAASFTATATLEDGTTADVTASIMWVSSQTGVATVTAGTVTGVAVGTTVISARDAASGISSNDGDRSATITVRDPPPTSIEITPNSVMIPIGRTQQFTAVATYGDGSTRDLTSVVSWSSTAPDVAPVSTATGTEGLVTALSVGFASIVATHDASGVMGVGTIRVLPPQVTTLTITPAVATVDVNATQSFEAMATLSDGSMRNVTAMVVWSVSDPLVASVSNAPGLRGRIDPVTTGTITVSVLDEATGVSSDDSGGSATLYIVPPSLVSINVVPGAPAVPAGLTISLQAFGIFSDNSGAEITNRVIWTSSNPAVATVNAQGQLTAVSVGLTTVSARDPVSGINSNDSSTSSNVEVRPAALLSIAVTPSTASMVVGSMQQFTATGTYTNGVPVNLTGSATWVSSSPSLTIGAGGLATAISNGSAIITATDPVSGISSANSNQSASALVSEAMLVSIAITPGTVSVPPGADHPFTAMGTYNNGASVDITTLVTWASSNTAAATVSNTAGSRGVVNTLTPGMTTISALETFSGIGSNDTNQSAVLTVPGGITLQSVAVTPSAMTIDVSDTLQLTAQGTFSDASVHPMTESVTWSSSSPMIATVDNNAGSRGVATGVDVGVAVIAATHTPSGISSTASNQSASITVERGIEIADIVHYELEEGTGSVATNMAPNQPNGTINGNYTWNMPGVAPGAGTYRLTMLGSGITNVNPNLPTMNFTNLTIEFWWRYVGGSTGLPYMWNSTGGFRAFTNGVAGVGFYVRTTPGGADVIYTPTVQHGNWLHFAYVLNAAAGTGTLYINGAPSGSTTYSGSISLAAWYILGQNSTNGTTVEYDRFRIWSTALSATQVQEAFTGNR